MHQLISNGYRNVWLLAVKYLMLSYITNEMIYLKICTRKYWKKCYQYFFLSWYIVIMQFTKKLRPENIKGLNLVKTISHSTYYSWRQFPVFKSWKQNMSTWCTWFYSLFYNSLKQEYASDKKFFYIEYTPFLIVFKNLNILVLI